MTRKSLMVAAFAAFALAAAPAAAADVVLKLGDDVAPASVQAKALDLIAKQVKAANVGLEIQVFHSNQLGTGVVQVQNVRLGIQDMVNTGTSLFDTLSEDLRVVETPFSFASREHFEGWLRSDKFEDIHREVIEKGNMRFLNLGVLWRRGPYRVMIATRPVLSLDDLSTVKLRVWESETIQRFWGKQGLGAIPVVIALADVYLGLRQGVVDAITMPFDLVVPFKFVEVAPHIMMLRQFPQIVMVAINEDKWKSLNAKQQEALVAAVDEGGRYYNSEIAANLENWKKQLLDMGAKFHEVDRKPFNAIIQKRNLEWQAQGYWRKGLIDEINAMAK